MSSTPNEMAPGTRMVPKYVYPEHLLIATGEHEDLFDERALDVPAPSFVESVRALGVVTPVTVRRVDEKDPRRADAVMGLNKDTTKELYAFEIVDGRQRVAALCLVNKEREEKNPPLPPLKIRIVLRGEPIADLLEVMLAANAQRKDDPPGRRARAAKRALGHGLTKPKIARAYGFTTKALNNLLRLLDLAPEVQRAVDEGLITYTLAVKKLARLPLDQQAEKLAKLLANGTTRGAAADAAAEEMCLGRDDGREDDGDEDDGEGEGEEKPRRQKTRSRPFLESFVLALSRSKLKRDAALTRFIMGGDNALRGKDFSDLRELAAECGWAT